MGDVITIPNAPVREGYAFMYWKGSEYQPGEKYKVEGDHTFTAVWEKNASSDGGDDSSSSSASNDASSSTATKGVSSSVATKGVSSSATGNTTPKTGDDSAMPAIAFSTLAVASLCTLALSARRRNGASRADKQSQR